MLVYDSTEWQCFVEGVRGGEFDLPPPVARGRIVLAVIMASGFGRCSVWPMCSIGAEPRMQFANLST